MPSELVEGRVAAEAYWAGETADRRKEHIIKENKQKPFKFVYIAEKKLCLHLKPYYIIRNMKEKRQSYRMVKQIYLAVSYIVD